MVSIIGTSGNDTRVGTEAADFINLRQGNDIGSGLGSADLLRGGAGTDTLFGGGGRDLIRGDNGRDRLEGERGHDDLFGGEGNDRLLGEAGDDHLFGGGGRDRLEGGEDGNWLTGGSGLDRFVMAATDEAPFGLTVEEFVEALEDFRTEEELLVSAIAAGGADVITDAEAGEHAIFEAGFQVQDIFYSITGGGDGDGDGDTDDIFGVFGFFGAGGDASMKLFLLPDHWGEVDWDQVVQTATGADLGFIEFF